MFDICNLDSLMCTMANFSRFLLLTQFRPRTHFHITMTMRHKVRRLVFWLLLLPVSTSHCATRRSCDHLQQTMAGSHPLPNERGWKVRFACHKVVCYCENIYRCICGQLARTTSSLLFGRSQVRCTHFSGQDSIERYRSCGPTLLNVFVPKRTSALLRLMYQTLIPTSCTAACCPREYCRL